MKKLPLLLLTALLASPLTVVFAQKPKSAASTIRSAKTAPTAAQTYYLVLLKAAKASGTDPELAATVRAAHMAYLQQLQKDGKLALAGSCPGPDQNLQLMYLLSVPNLEEAQVLTAADPSVKLGQLAAEVYPWVGQGRSKL